MVSGGPFDMLLNRRGFLELVRCVPTKRGDPMKAARCSNINDYDRHASTESRYLISFPACRNALSLAILCLVPALCQPKVVNGLHDAACTPLARLQTVQACQACCCQHRSCVPATLRLQYPLKASVSANIMSRQQPCMTPHKSYEKPGQAGFCKAPTDM